MKRHIEFSKQKKEEMIHITFIPAQKQFHIPIADCVFNSGHYMLILSIKIQRSLNKSK